jgi:hypothetical protein
MKRHVWCSIRHQQPPSPGLLLDWRKDDSGDWEALVIVMTQSSAHKDFDGTATVWVPARNLSPAVKD